MLKKSTKKELLDSLRLFNCTDLEAEIYLESYQSGPASVQELARKLECNRVTVHSAIEQLINQGFLFETKKGKKRLIVAESPTNFERLVEARKKELFDLEQGFQRLNDVLSAVMPPDGHLPAIEFYEDSSGFKRLL